MLLERSQTFKRDNSFRPTVSANFKAPKQIVISASLPKIERGKLDRNALAEKWKSNLR